MRVLLVLTAVVSAVFYVFPGFDIAVSQLFYTPGKGFLFAKDPSLQMARKIGEILTTLVVVAALLAIVVPLSSRFRLRYLKPSAGLYVLAVYVLGPGLLVNGFFKNFFGRARPRELLEFGHGAHFTPVWQIAGDCSGNCSFVSGEGAAAAALFCLLAITPRPLRGVAAAGLLVVAGALSLARIAYGGHFVSDVLLAWLLVLMVAAALKPLMLGARGEAIDAAVETLAGHCAGIRAWTMTRLTGRARRARLADKDTGPTGDV